MLQSDDPIPREEIRLPPLLGLLVPTVACACRACCPISSGPRGRMRSWR